MRTRPLNWGFIQFHVVRCLAAAGMVALLTTILFLLRSELGTPVVALLYLLPVGLAALLWGLPAALTAAVGAFLTFNYFFIPPYSSLAVHTPSDLLALLTFLVVATVISQLMGRARGREADAKARERDAVHLYELTLALAGLTTREAIAHALAGQLQTKEASTNSVNAPRAAK